MACFVSDGFQEALGESMTALKLEGLCSVFSYYELCLSCQITGSY